MYRLSPGRPSFAEGWNLAGRGCPPGGVDFPPALGLACLVLLLCVQTPFIRYEYVLPSSHPPPPPPSPHGMEDSAARGEQPSSYRVLYPYVPPALDRDFYTPPEPQPFSEPPHSSSPSPPGRASPPPPPASPPAVCRHEEAESSPAPPEGGEEGHRHHESPRGGGGEGWEKAGLENPAAPHVVDMPIVSRSFHPYETHYVEEPFLLINPDSPPPSVYESSDFELLLAEEAERLAPEEEEEEEEEGEGEERGQLVISVVDEAVGGESRGAAAFGEAGALSGDCGSQGAKEEGSSPVDATGVGDGASKVCVGGDHSVCDRKKPGVGSNQVQENGQAVSLGPNVFPPPCVLGVCSSISLHPRQPQPPPPPPTSKLCL